MGSSVVQLVGSGGCRILMLQGCTEVSVLVEV